MFAQQPGGNGYCILSWVVPFKEFESPGFKGRVYIT